ncbi:MAG: hypothetical protein ACOWWO_03265 [Peptococcaceae bacterium]
MSSSFLMVFIMFFSLILGGGTAWLNTGIVITGFYFSWVLWTTIYFTALNLVMFLFGGRYLKMSYQEESKLIFPIRIGFFLSSIMLVIEYINIP